MEYENRTVPEGINVSKDHPLKEFFILALGLGTAVVVLVVALSFAAGWLVQFVPFETELMLAEKFSFTGGKRSEELSEQANTKANEESKVQQEKIETYLQNLANQLSAAQQLPDGMTISVHYIDDDMVNAFATLGGNIIIFKGLIEKLPNENALAMVMAHEIAHIKHRDPMVAAGRGLTIGLALASLAGFGDSVVAQQLLNKVGLITSMSFSRQQEEKADAEALNALLNYYGHVKGAEVLFEILKKEEQGVTSPLFLSTHPLNDKRISAIKNYREQQASDGELTDLPKLF
ncbi:MAG TPA: M48 family metallopeptidase [Pseudomonadales bacterium]